MVFDWRFLFIKLAPVTSLGLAIQALWSLMHPEDEIGRAFIQMATDLFVVEIVVMHSSVFLNALDSDMKLKVPKVFLKLVLFFGYGLFIIPIAQKNAYVGLSFILFNITHAFGLQPKHWLQEFEVIQKNIDEKTQKFLLGMYSLIKACYLGLFLTVISSMILPDFQISANLVKEIVPNENDPGFTIVCIKTLCLYFFGIFVFEVGLWFWKRSRGSV